MENLITTTTAHNDNGQRRFTRRFAGGVAAVLVASALTAGVAQAHGMGGGMGGGFRMQKVLEKVGATEGQRSQIKAIWEAQRPQLKAVHEQHAALRKQLTTAMTATTIDAAAVEKLRQQTVQLMDKRSALTTKALVDAAKVLTPEQRKQVAAELEKEKDHHRGHFQGRGEHGPDAL